MSSLSSNWKKLQAKLKAESASKPSAKRKADDETSAPTKAKKPKSSGVSKSGTTASKGPRESIPKRVGSIGGGKMGAAQSTLARGEQKHGVSPSAALWGPSAGGISPEAIAEAYQLGARDSSMVLSTRDDEVNRGLTPGLELGKYVAIDCEMVGVGPGGHASALARVSLVDFHGRQVYDSYVRPRQPVTDWRTPVSGIAPRDMRGARTFATVQQDVAALLDGRVLIGHDVRHDLEALQLSHPPRDVRDTVRHGGFKRHAHGRKPALRVLAQTLLNVEIQDGAHSSLEDARVTMLLFRRNKSEFDVDHANRYTPRPEPAVPGSSNTKKAKKKKR
ncbi:exonuclease, putative [Cordyceps militaris]|uniref:RNA exonuclease 4 n=1 Tax=Cordyceps militaris TaxID=73501 RepID=A0A2H4STB4_CORMI|nr:exonuclease, putative [Cordyceps militaris]